MKSLDAQIAAYENMQGELEKKYSGQWVVFHGGDLFGTYEDFQEAAKKAVEEFGENTFLLRQVGAPPIQPPVALMKGYVDAHS